MLKCVQLHVQLSGARQLFNVSPWLPIFPQGSLLLFFISAEQLLAQFANKVSSTSEQGPCLCPI